MHHFRPDYNGEHCVSSVRVDYYSRDVAGSKHNNFEDMVNINIKGPQGTLFDKLRFQISNCTQFYISIFAHPIFMYVSMNILKCNASLSK